MIDYQRYPQGSADKANTAMLREAGLFVPEGAYIGDDPASGRPCYAGGQAALYCSGGARSLKGSVVLPWMIDGCIGDHNGPHHIINLDLKLQDSVIAALQVHHGRHHYFYNPRGGHAGRGIPSHRMNPLGHLKPGMAALAAFCLLTAASIIPFSDPKARYFEGMAQKIVAAFLVTYVRLYGEVTFPGLAAKLSGLGTTSDEALSFEYEISRQPEPAIHEIATFLQEMRKSSSDTGGFAGIKNEISRAFNFMMDAQLAESVSPPFDFDSAMLTNPDSPPCMISIMEHLDFIDVSAPIIRALLTNVLINKRSAPLTARPQFWILNEIAHFNWPLAQDLATISAGWGIRTAYVTQSNRQLENLKSGASEVLPNSCGTQIYLGTRSVQQATLISKQLGQMSLDYFDPEKFEHARHARSRAMADLLFGSGDPVSSMLNAAHQERLAREPKKLSRALLSADEIINLPMGMAVVFMPGILPKPALLRIPPYWQTRRYAGAYMPDPFHPGKYRNTVEIATRWGQRHRDIITEPAPNHLADWPQYRDSGQWSYVKGFRP
ncbi:MAG: TraM recognition domain-containing protein [Pseudomonadota bacterium]